MFILASASPRRIQLLQQIGVEPEQVIPADIDEAPLAKELPRNYVARVSADKALCIAKQHPESHVLAADTIVACGRRILMKAESDAEVASFLKLLSGRRHRVYTAVHLVGPKGQSTTKTVQTTVQFKRLSDQEIAGYVSSQEGIGKAGGYAIQGRAEMFVKQINGSYSNVVGLPLYETKVMLDGLGL